MSKRTVVQVEPNSEVRRRSTNSGRLSCESRGRVVLSYYSVMSTADEIRTTLNDRDIELLWKRFLCALNDMDSGENPYFNFIRVYEQMGIRGYVLPLSMLVVVQDKLLPQKLILIENDQVRITEKGRRTCEQFRHTDQLEWEETMRRLDGLLTHGK